MFIDYSKATGIKLFQSATEALPIIFDADSKQVNLFCEALQDRAEKLGCDLAGGNVITIPDINGQNCNLITQYGQLTANEITAHVLTFVGQQSRQAQNSVQLYHCLKNSITKTAKLKILAELEKYI
eukprot:4921701-Ditylum_brightwellii.AAC.1